MRLLKFVCAFLFVVSAVVWAQDTQPSQPQQSQAQQQQQNPQPDSSQSGTQDSATPAQAQEQKSSGSSQDQQPQASTGSKGQKKPGPLTRLKRHVRNQISSGCVNAVINDCWNKPPVKKDPSGEDASQDVQQGKVPPGSDQLPRSDSGNGESSSKSTKIDLSPPPGERGSAPGTDTDNGSDVREVKPWDPHKADKNVEIGDFYFKQQNYRAAASRYKEALYWQDNHAIATEHLAEALEKIGDLNGARQYYQNYLKILPNGPDAEKVKESLQRLDGNQARSESTPK